MTRAKNHLQLFSCLNRSSAFIKEVQQNIPTEVPETNDVFRTFPTELCGKRYHHAQKGWGNILAACSGQCLIAYNGGETQFLTVGQMYEQRMVVRKLPEKPAVAKKTGGNARSQEAQWNTIRVESNAVPGRKGRTDPQGSSRMQSGAQAFGAGVVVRYQDPIVTIRFARFGEKKFVLFDSAERGLLHFN